MAPPLPNSAPSGWPGRQDSNLRILMTGSSLKRRRHDLDESGHQRLSLRLEKLIPRCRGSNPTAQPASPVSIASAEWRDDGLDEAAN
jgi:hypothetical protein